MSLEVPYIKSATWWYLQFPVYDLHLINAQVLLLSVHDEPTISNLYELCVGLSGSLF